MTKKTIQLFVKLIVVAVILFVFSFVVVMPQYGGNYQASMVDKISRLQSIEGPKIVLLGNSNLAFGMNSERLSQLTGMPVVNMGLHGGVGNAFNESVAKLNVCDGDIYIIVHDNWSDNDTIKNPELAWITIENHFNMWRFIRWKDIPDMALAYPTYLKKCIGMWSNGTGNRDTEPIYSRSQYNEYGDNIYPRPASTEDLELAAYVAVPTISDAYVNRVNELNAYVSERGATLLVAAYPIAWHEDAPPKEEYARFEEELKERLDCQVISDYTQYCFEPKYFFNTYLHLTDEGAKMRTELLIQDLKKYLEESGKQ